MTDRISSVKSGPATTFYVEGDLLSQSIAGNYSIVRCYLRAMNGPGGNSGSFHGGFGFQEGHVDGVQRFHRHEGNPFLPAGYADMQWRWREGPFDVRVNHAADGSHAPVRFAQVLSYGGVNETLFSGYIPLPTIARASVATFAGGSLFDMGSTITINTNRASSSFTHDIWFAHNTLGNIPIANGVGASTTWTIPLNLLDVWPNHTQVIFPVWTRTLQNGQRIGLDQRTYLTVRLPASAVPTVTAVNAADQNSEVASIVGKMVQGLSRAKLTVTGAGVYGSTIASAAATFEGVTVPSGGEVPVTGSGNLPVAATVTDSRGRVGSTSATLQALPYTPPTVSAYQARRSNASGVVQDDGANLRVDMTAAIASLLNSTQRNALTIRAFTRPRGTGPWTARNVIAPTGLAYNTSFVISGGAIFSTTSSWDVRVEVRDKFNVYIADTTVATIGVALDLAPGGLGVGKIHEQGALDVVGQIFQAGLPVIDVGDTATVSAPGIAELATQAEVDAGDATRIVTAATLRGRAYAPYAEAGGSVATSASALITVTLPAGRFTVTPLVVAIQSSGPTVSVPYVTNRTPTSFQVRTYQLGGTQNSSGVEWTATQMTATTAEG